MDGFPIWMLKIVRLPFVLYILWFNFNLWTTPASVIERAEVLSEELRNGAGADMQDLFPEGDVITNGLIAMSWIDIARENPERKKEAVKNVREIELRIDTEDARRIFPSNTHLKYGAFYRGYRGVVRAGILELDPKPEELEKFRKDFDGIALAIKTAPGPYLESYAGMAWPADTVFAVAALAIHDRTQTPRYTDVISSWLKRVANEPDDLIAHAAHPGKAPDIPRAVSNTVMSRMLWEIDPLFARTLYQKTRAAFAVSHFGFFSGMYEYPPGVSGAGDVDSGPLLFGISLSASVVGIAAARIHGDENYSRPVSQLFDAMGIPFGSRYAFGSLAVGEAFVLWADTTPRQSVTEYDQIVPKGWRFYWHLLSILVLVGFAIPEFVLRKRARRFKDASEESSEIVRT